MLPPLSVPPLLSACFAFLLATLVFTKKATSPVNRSFSLLCFQTFVWQACWFATYFHHEPAQKDLIIRIAWIAVVFIPFTYYEFAVRFLRMTGELIRVRWVYAFATVFLILTWVSKVFIAGYQDFWWGYYTKAGPLHPLYVAVVVCVMLRALQLLFWGMRDQTISEEERKRRRLAFRSHFLYLFAASEYAINYGVPMYPVGVVVMPAAFLVSTYGIVRHQLMDIRVVIRRSLVYSVLIACITACYLVAVLIMERWFQGFFGYRSFVATVVVAFLIAIFFNPLRNQIQALIDRALFKATPAELVAQREQLLAEIRKGEQMKAVGTLAAGLAHEVKNPLASIKTFTEYLSTKYDDPGFRAKFQKIVGGEVERINLIVQQLLEFAKPVPPKLAPIQIPALLDDTLEFLNGELVQRHVEVTRHYDTRQRVLGDPQQLKQVFLNLVLNSLQAMNGNGHLVLGTAIRGSDVEVKIADNGQGIDPNDLPRVFQPFFSTKPTGTGLGLAVVQGIVRDYGGRIAVESCPGQGTIVKLSLPMAL